MTYLVDIAIWRAAVPGDFSRHPVPMIRVTTWPPALAALDMDFEDELDARHRSYLWFRDRAGWRAAHRLARIIAAGRRVNPSLIEAEAKGAALYCKIAVAHRGANRSARPEHVAASVPPAVETFTAELRKVGSPLASLPPQVIEHLMNEDDKSAFIAWFEGRPAYQAEDWSTLLTILRELLPDLFAERGAP